MRLEEDGETERSGAAEDVSTEGEEMQGATGEGGEVAYGC